MRFSVSRAAGFDGSHLEDRGLDAFGDLITVPLHRHVVTLDITRVVVQVDYIIEEPWALRLRVPYETKKRSAAIEIIDPATASDIEAMQRNLDLHHGETLLSGVRDLDLLASWHSHHWRIDGDFLAISFGTSLPTGETEENPYLAAASAEAHEHIQFGSGSYDPLLELFYARPVGMESTLALFATGRFPVNENKEGYRGSNSIVAGFSISKPLSVDWQGSMGIVIQDEDHATWSGAIDPNTGYRAISAQIGLGHIDTGNRSWSLSLTIPISNEVKSGTGENYDPATAVTIAVGF